ncbi:MAG: hypothetical protein IPJ48_12655 [Propionivibrio sp.]|uniref:Uncharacterized protein n=1 Tax=Candidatus Propionivibrio dominans TaxID=2954373 RepID=A0A9D7F838_9RHOO|nr:hypothetical protein [Candidatus Propionivibrio dominans]MBL0165608.1 hypothetical protein [Propionivibrio sp.]
MKQAKNTDPDHADPVRELRPALAQLPAQSRRQTPRQASARRVPQDRQGHGKITIRQSPIKHPDIRLNMRPMSMAFTATGNALLDKGGFAA